MATNKAPDSEKDNDASLPTLPEQDGLTADQAAEHNYSEADAWDKSKYTLLTVLGFIVLGVVAYTWLDNSKRSEQSDRSYRFLSASIDSEGAEERFLSFADEYDDELSGVARFRASVLQYREKKYIDSAKNFELAVTELGADPLAGRALLGQAVSLLKIKDKKVSDGKVVLEQLAESSDFLPTDRREAIFLLALQSLSENDMEMVEEHKSKLADDSNASYFLSRIEDLIKTSKFLTIAKSMPDINLEKGNAFLKKNGKRAGVISTDSGLQYEILEEGTGESPQEEDSVDVHYHGTLINGEVFDSSLERDVPASFAVNGVIKGWTEAIILMNVGSKWKLFIPSDLAYGESGNNSIGPNETLIFEVELIGITPKKIPEPPLDLNLTDTNSSSVDATLIIPEVDANSTVPVVEEIATAPADGNGSE
jgi:FKBP-type peptidyl-prolyl cis-trans isomerase FklB